MPRPLLITLLVLGTISFLLAAASYFIPALRGERSESTRFVARCIFTAAIATYLVWLFMTSQAMPFRLLFHTLFWTVILLMMWGSALASIFGGMFGSLFDGGNDRVKPEPLYSMAEARRKQGKIREAMYEVQAQLEKFPNDFRGQMMLAEIQAENADDLAGAEATIHRLCTQKGHSPNQIAAALSTLADWHLSRAQDPDAARAAFLEIIERFPDTDLALNAETRIAHLADAATLIDARAPRTIHYTPKEDVWRPPGPAVEKEVDVTAEAQRLIDHLNSFPHDTEAREELAKLYAERFGRLDLATEQLEQLIAAPTESPRHVVRWLNLLADLQVQCSLNTEAAGVTLQRIIDRFPQPAFAEPARQRLMTLQLEVKRYEKSRVVKLGSSDSKV